MIDALIQIFVLLGTALWQIVATAPADQPASAVGPASTAVPAPAVAPAPAPDEPTDDCDFEYHYDSDEDPTFNGRVSVNFKCSEESRNNSTSTVKTNADINTGGSSGDVKVDISVKNKIGS